MNNLCVFTRLYTTCWIYISLVFSFMFGKIAFLFLTSNIRETRYIWIVSKMWSNKTNTGLQATGYVELLLLDSICQICMVIAICVPYLIQNLHVICLPENYFYFMCTDPKLNFKRPAWYVFLKVSLRAPEPNKKNNCIRWKVRSLKKVLVIL